MPLTLLNNKDISTGQIYSIDSSSLFPVGSPLYYNGTSLLLSDGSDSAKDAQFVVSKRIAKSGGGYRYYLMTSGILTLSDTEWRAVNGGASLVPGKRYYVSSTPGIYSQTLPGTVNISLPPLLAISTTDAFVYTNSFSQRVRLERDISNSGSFNAATNPRTLSMVDILSTVSSGVYKFYLKEVPTVGGTIRFANQSSPYNTLYTVDTSSAWIGGTKNTNNLLNIYVESDIIRFQNKLGSSSPSTSNPPFPITALNLVFVSDI